VPIINDVHYTDEELARLHEKSMAKYAEECRRDAIIANKLGIILKCVNHAKACGIDMAKYRLSQTVKPGRCQDEFWHIVFHGKGRNNPGTIDCLFYTQTEYRTEHLDFTLNG